LISLNIFLPGDIFWFILVTLYSSIARLAEMNPLHITNRNLAYIKQAWEDNIKMDLREIGFGDVDWIHWAQDRDRWRTLVNTVMNLRVP
jgi:hypothetical protein